MIQQTAMPFKLKRTDERMTSRSGLALYAEFMQAMGVDELVSRCRLAILSFSYMGDFVL